MKTAGSPILRHKPTPPLLGFIQQQLSPASCPVCLPSIPSVQGKDVLPETGRAVAEQE